MPLKRRPQFPSALGKNTVISMSYSESKLNAPRLHVALLSMNLKHSSGAVSLIQASASQAPSGGGLALDSYDLICHVKFLSSLLISFGSPGDQF